MPRAARIVIPGIPYHITQRGNRGAAVFFSDADRLAYLDWIREYTARFGVEVLAYCLMTNHVHLVAVPASEDGLFRVLRPVNLRHAQRINRAREWTGHLWQGRFFSSALDERYLLAAVRYVERNPVRAGLVTIAERYRWSSAPGHCGLRVDPLLTKRESWAAPFEGIGDWPSWLAEDEDACVTEIRRHTERCLPCGSERFVGDLERLTGRSLAIHPRGRPPARESRPGDTNASE